MAVTRIKNNQITDNTIEYTKIKDGTLVGSKFNSDLTLNSNISIVGNLQVTGNTTTVNSINTFINDPLVIFNNGYVGIPSYDIGMLVNRNLGSFPGYGSYNTAWIWDEADKAFAGFLTTDTGETAGAINKSFLANLLIGNVNIANALTVGTRLTAGLSQFTAINNTVIGNVTPLAANFTVANATTGQFGTVTTIGNVNVGANAIITDTIFVGNIVTTAPGATGNISGVNYLLATGVKATGNITADYFIGNIQTSSANLTTIITTNATITGGNITNVTILSANTATFSNISTSNILVTGGNITNLTNVTSTSGNIVNLTSSNVEVTGGNITNITNLTAITSNITNLTSSNSTITGGNVTNLTNLSSTEGNIVNLISSNVFSTGNVTASGQLQQESTFVAIGSNAGNVGQGNNAVAFGTGAGETNQGTGAVSIGLDAGQNTQGGNAVAVGSNSGTTTQGDNAVAFGNVAGQTNQGTNSVAVGDAAGQTNQGTNSVAVGDAAGQTTQGNNAVAVGSSSGTTTQGNNAVAVGNSSGTTTQGDNAVAIGNSSGTTSQGGNAVAIGSSSGTTTQGTNSVAVGNSSGQSSQGIDAVAIGNSSGQTTQGNGAVAIGSGAGSTSQGDNSIAIGTNAGVTSQATNSIILNANGTVLNSSTSGFFVDPIRNLDGDQFLQYNTITKEVTYSSNVSVTNVSTSNAVITGGYADSFTLGGNIAANANVNYFTVNGITTFANTTNSLPYVMGSGAVYIAGGVSIAKDLWMGGNLYVANIVSQNSTILEISDPLVYLNANSATYNYDIGIFSQFVDPIHGQDNYTGWIRSYIHNYWGAFSNISTPPSNGVIDFADPDIIWDTIKAGDLIVGNTTVATSTTSGALRVHGGAGIEGRLFVGGNLVAASDTSSTAYNNGAIVIAGDGGMGIGGNLHVRGEAEFIGNISAGNIELTGNINVSVGAIASSYGVFYGDLGTGVDALYAGKVGFTFLPNVILQMTADLNNYAQINFQNVNSGDQASADFVITADNGDDTQNYINLGLGSSTHDVVGQGAYYPNDGYLLMNGGNLLLNVEDPAKMLRVAIGGYEDSNLVYYTSTSNVHIVVTTESVDTSTGALIVDGGLAVKGNINGNLAQFAAINNTVIGNTSPVTATFSNVSSNNGNIVNLTSSNVNIIGGNVTNITNLTAITSNITNLTSSNVEVTGGNVTNVTNLTAVTSNITNLTSSNVEVTGGNVTNITNLSSSEANVVNLTSSNINVTGGNISNVLTLTTTTANITNLTSANILIQGGYLDNVIINPNVSTSGSFTTVNVGGIQVEAIGNVTPGTGAFTTLSTTQTFISTGNIVANSNITSTSSTTGALVIAGDGGAAIGGNVFVGQGAVINSTQSTTDTIIRGSTEQSLIYVVSDPVYDQVTIGGNLIASNVVQGAKLQINSTDSMLLPIGNNAERPSNQGFADVEGMFRYSTVSHSIEYYNGTSWEAPGVSFTVITSTQFALQSGNPNGNVDGINTQFVLPAAATTNGVIVTLNGVVQLPTTAYSIGGINNDIVTFTEAPQIGDVIDVRTLTTTAQIDNFTGSNGYFSLRANEANLQLTTGSTSANVTTIWLPNGAEVNSTPNVTIATSALATNVDAFSSSVYSSAEYTATATIAGTNVKEISKVIIVSDGTIVETNQFANACTAGNSLVAYSAQVIAGNVYLQGTATNNNTIVRLHKNYQAI
jgi:hypothetical protein